MFIPGQLIHRFLDLITDEDGQALAETSLVLAFIALLFNPIVPVPLPKAMWAIESAKLCRANQSDARKAP